MLFIDLPGLEGKREGDKKKKISYRLVVRSKKRFVQKWAEKEKKKR